MIRIYPILHLFFAYFSVIVCLAFVPPKPMMRLSAFGAVLAYAIFGLLHLDRSRISFTWLEFCTECTCGVLLYANNFIFLMRLAPPPGSNRLKWAIGVVANPRGIGAKWQIKNLPPFSREDPKYIPPRLWFIVDRVLTGFIIYGMMEMFNVTHQNIYINNLQNGDYDEDKESVIRRIRDVSLRELFIRAWLPLDTLFVVWCQHRYLHSFVSAIAVTLGDEPSRWPPLYGDVREAYSLRRFWSSFWHSTLRSAFIANASFLTQTLLGIPKSSRLYRGAVTLLVFCFTAALHAVGFWSVSPTCNIMPVLRWYILMSAAIVFEDLMKKIYWWLRGGCGKAVSGWWKTFGYVWVWVYLGWSLPKLKFPEADCVFEYT